MKTDSNQQRIQSQIDELSQKRRKDLSGGQRVRLLQLKLYQKSKQEKTYRFYVLYDKIFLGYLLAEAYKRVKSKAGSPGVDKMTFDDIEGYGRDKFLAALSEDLRRRTYKPSAVKRVWIDKENGGKRPLGIPTIRDRVAQAACKLVIEPIFEADFKEVSYGFRPRRGASGAISTIKSELKAGKGEVYDADLSAYFDTIPHEKLMKAVKERIIDPRVLHLLKLWLKVAIVEEDGRYTGGKKRGKGTPQGGVISPLLANIYMHLLDRIVSNPEGMFAQRGIVMIRYADDFILMAKEMDAACMDQLQKLLVRMELKINEKKSKLIDAYKAPFDFLGFRISYNRSVIRKGSKFWSIKPKPESEKKIRQKINAKLKLIGHYPAAKVAAELNPIIRGWQNYYRINGVSQTQVSFRKLQDYLRERLNRYYHRKSQRRSRLYGQQAFEKLVKEYGLIDPYKSLGLRPVNAR